MLQPSTRHYPVHAAVTKNNGRHYRSEIMVANEEEKEEEKRNDDRRMDVKKKENADRGENAQRQSRRF